MTRTSRFSLVCIGLALVSGCGSDQTKQSAGSQPAEPPSSSEMIWAEGWSEIQIVANYAQTKVDGAAHFATTRNACGLEAYGALELSPWNELARNINRFLAETRLPEPRCRDLPSELERNLKFDGTAELVLNDGRKIPLLEYRAWTACSTATDVTLHRKILEGINAFVMTADKEDCARSPWGTVL